MVVQDLTAAEYKQMALDLLVRADDALMARDYDSVSPMLWGALEHALAAAAVECGWQPPQTDDETELREIVKRLEKERGKDKILDYMSGAGIFKDNMNVRYLEDYEFDFFAPSTSRFVLKLLNQNGVDTCNSATGE